MKLEMKLREEREAAEPADGNECGVKKAEKGKGDSRLKIYKKLTFVAMIIAAASLATAMIMHYFLPCTETDFWINVCLGIFGSAFLTILTSIMSYNHEKEKTLERFLYHTRQILTVANKYQEHMTLEEKIRFFLE